MSAIVSRQHAVVHLELYQLCMPPCTKPCAQQTLSITECCVEYASHRSLSKLQPAVSAACLRSSNSYALASLPACLPPPLSWPGQITSSCASSDLSCSCRLVTLVVLLLLLGLITTISSARALPNCQDDSSSSSGCSTVQQFQMQAASPARKWFGLGPAIPWYPTGDCATECSHNPAPLMRHCTANAKLGIPETTCKPVGDAGVCPTRRYLDAV